MLRLILWLSFWAGSGIASASFLAPNEKHPAHMSPHLTRVVPERDLFVVGSERAYFAALLYGDPRRIFIADGDPAVTRFHAVNLELLRAAKSREDYLKLRFAKDFSPWETLKTGLSREDFLFWHANVGHNREFKELYRRLPREVNPLGGDVPEVGQFAHVNYLEDDSLFSRVKQWADEGRVRLRESNFSRLEDRQALSSWLGSEEAQLELVDLSNIPTGALRYEFPDDYITRTDLFKLLRLLRSHASKDAKLVYSMLHSDSSTHDRRRWDYSAVPLIRFRKWNEFLKVFPLPERPWSFVEHIEALCGEALKRTRQALQRKGSFP